MLEIRRLDVYYGPLQALRDVSMHVDRGAVVSIIGANGAGKTTLLRTISGLQRSARGTILFENREITKAETPDIVRLGIGHVPAGRQIFPNLTVVENLRMGAYTRTGLGHNKLALKRDHDHVLELFPILGFRARQKAGTLSGGEQQMLAIGRALMARPRLLLLDEPSLGLAPQVLEGILVGLQSLNRDQDLTLLLIEQNAHLALDFASEVYVLENGCIVDHGPTRDLRDDRRIANTYLGVDA
jgi:branched-chain amino acid transport system ATP-binding protein